MLAFLFHMLVVALYVTTLTVYATIFVTLLLRGLHARVRWLVERWRARRRAEATALAVARVVRRQSSTGKPSAA